MIKLQKKVIEWGNSAGVYVPRKYVGKTAYVQILEVPKLSERYAYGVATSMECYGYELFKPDSFAPELRPLSALKGFNTFNYDGEEIRIMPAEDVILELIRKNPDFRLITGIPVILRNYNGIIDFSYLMAEAQKAGKAEFLGYLLEVTLRILERHSERDDLRPKLKAAIKKLEAAMAKPAKMRFLNVQLERLYRLTKDPDKIESTKRDGLMRKWNIDYISKEAEFEHVYGLYCRQALR